MNFSHSKPITIIHSFIYYILVCSTLVSGTWTQTHFVDTAVTHPTNQSDTQKNDSLEDSANSVLIEQTVITHVNKEEPDVSTWNSSKLHRWTPQTLHNVRTKTCRPVCTGDARCLRKCHSKCVKRHDGGGKGGGDHDENWTQFIFKWITSSDFHAVKAHLRRSFYMDEPLSHLIGFPEMAAQELDAIVLTILEDNLSLGVYDKVDGEMVGSLIVSCDREHPHREKPHEKLPSNSTELRIILDFLKKTGELVNLFQKYNVQKYLNLFMVSVDPPYRRHGLATEMYRRSITRAIRKGFKVVKSVCTSPYTRTLTRKLGFEELGRSLFRNIRDSQGHFPYSQLDDEQCAALMAKQIVE